MPLFVLFLGAETEKRYQIPGFMGNRTPEATMFLFFVLRPRKGVDLAPTVATHHTVPRERNSIWACILAFKDDGVTESRAPSFHGTQLSHTHRHDAATPDRAKEPNSKTAGEDPQTLAAIGGWPAVMCKTDGVVHKCRY